MSESREEADLEWEEWNPKRISFLNHVVAGSCAGLAEHVSIFPLDTLKTQLQCERCGSSSPFKTWNCAERIVRNEGMFRLWRGVSAMFAGCVPAHAAYFSIFEYTKMNLITNSKDKLDASQAAIRASMCGASAAFAHDVCMTPFDTVKQRMQLGYYKSVSHCVRTIVKSEGMGALYVSMPTTMAMNIPYGMVMVAVNEAIREHMNKGQEHVSLYSSMVAGSVAGMIAAALTNPLDVIKTRLQTQYLEPLTEPRSLSSSAIEIPPECVGPTVRVTHTSPSSGAATVQVAKPVGLLRGSRLEGALHAAKRILGEEGMHSFSRGVIPRVLVHAPAVAVSWTAYEAVKQALTGI